MKSVELFSSPGDEGSLSMLKKAVTCPSVLAPGAPGVSNGDCWDCLVSPCFIIDLPVHTRTPDVTDPIAPTDGLTGGTYRAIRTPFLVRGFQGSTRSKRLCLPITSF